MKGTNPVAPDGAQHQNCSLPSAEALGYHLPSRCARLLLRDFRHPLKEKQRNPFFHLPSRCARLVFISANVLVSLDIVINRRFKDQSFLALLRALCVSVVKPKHNGQPFVLRDFQHRFKKEQGSFLFFTPCLCGES
jgi:hypothetical protein